MQCAFSECDFGPTDQEIEDAYELNQEGPDDDYQDERNDYEQD